MKIDNPSWKSILYFLGDFISGSDLVLRCSTYCSLEYYIHKVSYPLLKLPARLESDDPSTGLSVGMFLVAIPVYQVLVFPILR